jgi:hypothetical protein
MAVRSGKAHLSMFVSNCSRAADWSPSAARRFRFFAWAAANAAGHLRSQREATQSFAVAARGRPMRRQIRLLHRQEPDQETRSVERERRYASRDRTKERSRSNANVVTQTPLLELERHFGSRRKCDDYRKWPVKNSSRAKVPAPQICANGTRVRGYHSLRCRDIGRANGRRTAVRRCTFTLRLFSRRLSPDFRPLS